MLSIYIVSLSIFLSVVLLLVFVLLLVEAAVVQKGDRKIIINEDADKSIRVPSGATLLAALTANSIYLPSACGGKGSCAMCKCNIDEGGRGVLPTELGHLTRTEKLENVRLSCQVKVKEDMKIRIPPEIFSIKKYNATVVSNENAATFIKELVLELEAGERIDFESGQYIQIDIPEYELDYGKIEVLARFRSTWDRFGLWGLNAQAEEPVYRAYSMANTPEEDVLRFTIRIATPPPDADVPPGIASSFLFGLKPGDKLTLSGPYGDFLIKDTDREMCFIGGGAGMAPMRSHIFTQLLIEKTSRRMTFWYGARSKQEMFFDDEFLELDKNHDNFSYHVALSEPQPEDHWEGFTGFIHQAALDNYLSTHEDPTEIEYYLCGPPMMIRAVKIVLDGLGVEPEMIAFDDFG
ncbi:MAG TPA: NADH:ubiquinone reductase (Na(+)-transporting) subunit F [Deltaproteobacteria bacterium]|nr:NADH:ubiquinone reductase (Na(+)-transporting) subunit F [Deltaproteobacteria bacterium]